MDDLFRIQTHHRVSIHLHQQITRMEKSWEPQTTVSLSRTFTPSHADGVPSPLRSARPPWMTLAMKISPVSSSFLMVAP